MTTTNPTKDELREEIEILHTTLTSRFTRTLLGTTLLADLEDSYDDLDSRSATRGILGALIVIGDRLEVILDRTAGYEDDTDSFDDAPDESPVDKKLTEFLTSVLKDLL